MSIKNVSPKSVFGVSEVINMAKNTSENRMKLCYNRLQFIKEAQN